MNADQKLAAIRELHAEFGIYDECDHEHTEEDVQSGRATEVLDVGYTCDEARMYTICRECCVDGDYQTEACVYHKHGPDIPRCATIRILDEDPS